MDAETGSGAASERTNRTPQKERELAEDKKAWLEEFKKHVDVGLACKAIGKGKSTVYEWRDEDPAFYRAWRACFRGRVDDLEVSAFERAIHGTKNPTQNGERQEWETALTIFMLKKNKPEIYADDSRVGEITASDYAKRMREALAAMNEAAPQGATDEPIEGV